MINKIINLKNNNNNRNNNEILKLTIRQYCYLYQNQNNSSKTIFKNNIIYNNINNSKNNNNSNNNKYIYNNNNNIYNNIINLNKNYNYNRYYSTIKNNNNNSYNNLNEFSFKVEKEVNKGDLLLNDSKSLNLSIRHYEDALKLTKDRIERALIYHRIALVKFKIGLLTESNDVLELSLKLITNGIGDLIREEFKGNPQDELSKNSFFNSNKEYLFKIYTLKSMIQEKEFDLKNDPESNISQKVLEKAIELWKFVILLSPNQPDGYCGVSRCILKQTEPDLVACFNLSNKALICSKSHPPSLLLASEMLIIQNKDTIASAILTLFFKYYKEFYSKSLLYTLKPKELVDAHFRYGLTLLKSNKFQQAFEEFTQSLNISKSNISHPNQMNIVMINALMEKEKLQFENNYNYNNIKMFSETEKQENHNLIEEHGLVSNYNSSNAGIDIIPSDQFKFNYNDCSILDIISSHYFRGKSLVQLNRFNDAILDFSYVIENQPSQVKAFKERAECYKSLGDFISYQKDIKVFNDYQDQIKKRRETHFEDYLDDKKSKDYLQSFNNREEEDDDDDEDSYDDYDEDEEEEDYNENQQQYQDYDEFEDSRYKKRR